MKVVIISDTHGHCERLSAYLAHHVHEIDEIWHLGDYHRDVKEFPDIPVYAVRGNGDQGEKVADSLVLNRYGFKILLTHGHLYHVKSSLARLFYKALEEKIDIVCFGHTHKPLNIKEEGVRLFNPGSPSHPYPYTAASIGMIEFSDNNAILKHVHL